MAIRLVSYGVFACFLFSGWSMSVEGQSIVRDAVFTATVDGTQQRYVEILPAGFDAKRKIDVLITLHGHGSDRWQFIKQTRGECEGARQVAARHAMLLVSPDYRARTSWMGPAAEADLVQIIGRLKRTYPVGHIILMGGSMGATGALTFTALHPKLIDGVVALNGTADLVHYEKFGEAIANSFGGTRAQIPDQYRKRSALYYPQKFKMPVACTTGGRDVIVPPDSVLKLLEQVRRHSKHVLSIHRVETGHSTSFEDTVKAIEFVVKALGNSK